MAKILEDLSQALAALTTVRKRYGRVERLLHDLTFDDLGDVCNVAVRLEDELKLALETVQSISHHASAEFDARCMKSK